MITLSIRRHTDAYCSGMRRNQKPFPQGSCETSMNPPGFAGNWDHDIKELLDADSNNSLSQLN